MQMYSKKKRRRASPVQVTPVSENSSDKKIATLESQIRLMLEQMSRMQDEIDRLRSHVRKQSSGLTTMANALNRRKN